MDVRGTVEVVSWVLGFGDKAEVLEPPALRAEVADEVKRAARIYYALPAVTIGPVLDPKRGHPVCTEETWPTTIKKQDRK